MAIREQERARFALEKVNEVAKGVYKNRGGQDEFKTQLVKLPARLHMSGLGQTVAFYLSAGESSLKATICGWLEDWLKPAYSHIYQDNRSLIVSITNGTPADYRRASAEVRALAVWLKRFAEAFIEDRPEART